MHFQPGDLVGLHVEPTYLSTDLVTPGKLRRVTLPAIAKHPRQGEVQLPWGNEALRCHHDKITNNGFSSSEFPSLTVDLTHKHFGTRSICMDSVFQPYELTALRLSKCRVNDQRLPSFDCDLIPDSKITEAAELDKTNSYFSHREKFAVFPRSDVSNPRVYIAHLDQNGEQLPSSNGSKMRLSWNTLREINNVNKGIYHTTTYMENFPPPQPPKRSNLKSRSRSDRPRKRVSFEDTVKVFDKEVTGIKDLRSDTGDDEHTQNFLSREERSQILSDGLSSEIMPNDAGFKEGCFLCSYCGKRKRRGVNASSNNGHANTWETEDEDLHELSVLRSPVQFPMPDADCILPGDKNIVAKACGSRPRGPKRYFDICQCENNSQLRQSLLKAEAIMKRRAANFERRNYTTISVFNKLEDSSKNLKSSAQGDTIRKKLKKNCISIKQPLNQKTEAHERFHKRFPESAPDLRDAMKPLRRVMFCGFHSYDFR